MSKPTGLDLGLSGMMTRATTMMRKATSVQKSDVPMPTVNNLGSGDFFIRMAFDLIVTCKDYRRNEPLKNAIQQAIAALDSPDPNSLVVFYPFQIACRSGNPEMLAIAVDCLGKLFSYNYWKSAAGTKVDSKYSAKKEDEEGDNDGTEEIIAFAIDTICEGFSGESTDEKVQLQIIKALQAALTNSDPAFSLHGAVLLKAIRTTYNIFLLSKSAHVQMVAQGTVIQMVQNVMGRIPKVAAPIRLIYSDQASASNHDSTQTEISITAPDAPKDSLLINRSDPELKLVKDKLALDEKQSKRVLTQEEYSKLNSLDLHFHREIKDAFKVFRTLCILSMKPIPTSDNSMDLRSQPIRSKLLALHLISNALSSHIYVFAIKSKALAQLSKESGIETPTFIDAVKEFLIMSLSRNATSNIPPVFEVSLQIFGHVLTNLRIHLKKEISVFFTEIVIPILEAKKNISWFQRHAMLESIFKIFSDPSHDGGRILVEIYVNYDCDVEASVKENIWERLTTTIAKILSQHTDAANQGMAYAPIMSFAAHASDDTPPLTTANLLLFSKDQLRDLLSSNGDMKELKTIGLESLVLGILNPLVLWCDSQRESGILLKAQKPVPEAERLLEVEHLNAETIAVEADPDAFGSMKQRKQNIIEGVKRFNFKPKKGIQFLVETKCIASGSPSDIAAFLLYTEGLNKAMIGEYMGEGDEHNINTMHEFVDLMEFTDLPFVDALRTFLQSFRLPGEAQKIDRYMLKFAERYLHGNPVAFSSADTAYVLAYSVILLNTDQHNAQVKKRMTKADFVKNNRGIDNGKNLDEAVLGSIYDIINSNEIIMKDEKKVVVAPIESEGIADVLFGKKREYTAGVTANSESMAIKSEAMFSNILKSKGTVRSGKNEGLKSHFFAAKRFEHVKPMFEIIWMSILAGISTLLQETEDMDSITTALLGFKHAIHISSVFEMELEMKAFLSTLTNFTLLNNLQKMKLKNFEAIKTLIDIGLTEGNSLQESWRDVITCISQLEKILILGATSEDEQPKGRMATGNSIAPKRDLLKAKGTFLDDIAAEVSSQGMTMLIDRIFTGSVKLSGKALVHFVKALCKTSWDEITNSVDKEQPRMYCLQKLVEISYFNMKRIRVEWSNMWTILCEHFKQVGCYPNTTVGFFAIDKLRQLSLKFLEIEELPNYKFQRDFLRPFEEIIQNNLDPKIKDMCLVCLQQLIQAKGKSIKSGWKTIFGCILRAARETNESLVNIAYEMLKTISKQNFETFVSNGSFSDFVICLSEFCKNKKTPKIRLQAIEHFGTVSARINEYISTLKLLPTPIVVRSDTIDEIVEGNNRRGSVTTFRKQPTDDDYVMKYWMPMLFGLHDIIMTSDLEIRTKALSQMFDTFKIHGGSFTRQNWELLSKGVIFPIFEDLKQVSSAINLQNSKFANKEDMSIWISTTLIQALTQLVDMFSHYFTTLSFMMPEIFSLLKVCLTHENETLSRIGSTCLQKMLSKNASLFDAQGWSEITALFAELFEDTMPYFLFFKYDEADPDFGSKFLFLPQPLGLLPDKKEFQKQIPKCAIHSLVIQTLQEALSDTSPESLFQAIPAPELMKLMDCFQKSFQFSSVFNECTGLRTALHKKGYMAQVPNLLKIETSSVQYHLEALVKLFSNKHSSQQQYLAETESRLIPLCYIILARFNSLPVETNPDQVKKRNENAWKPVIGLILSGVVHFNHAQFQVHGPRFYNEFLNLLLQDITPDIRASLHAFLVRIGQMFKIVVEL